MKLDSETPSGQLHFLYLPSSFLHIKREIATSSLWAYILTPLPPKRKGLLPSNSVGGILRKNANKFGFSHMFVLETKATLSPREKRY